MDITITFDVEGHDPTLVDPHDIADLVLDSYNEWAKANNKPEFGHNNMSAEWA